MLFIKEYLSRNIKKYLPLLVTISILIFVVTLFCTFTTIFTAQRVQLFEQYRLMTPIILEERTSAEEISHLKDYLREYQVKDVTISYWSEKLVFGQELGEMYGIDYEDLTDINHLLFQGYLKSQTVDKFAILTVDFIKSSQSIDQNQYYHRGEYLPVVDIKNTGKYGILVGVKNGLPGLLVLDALTSSEVIDIGSKFSIVRKIENYHTRQQNLRSDLKFINGILNICIYTILLLALVLTGVSTNLTVNRRKSEIAIYYILGISKSKILFKFFMEILVISLSGVISGILLGYTAWNLTIKQSLKSMGTTLGYSVSHYIFIFLLVSIFAGLFIIFRVVKSLDPIEVITKNNIICKGEMIIMIKVQSLEKCYSDQVIFSNVSFQIEKGEFIGIIGESGVGKSTLLYTLSGLKKSTNGQIIIADQNITNMNQTELLKFRYNHFGFIFQENYLINYLTVKENILLPVKKVTATIDRRLKEVVEFLRIADLLNKLPHTLSVGQKQRVSIARALINEPSVLFADEPTASLDETNAKNVITLLNDYRKMNNVTIIMVSHSKEHWTYFDRLIQIKNNGVLVYNEENNLVEDNVI